MSVIDAWPFQQAIYSAVAAAVAAEGLEVFDHIPTNPPAEYIRLEGFDIANASSKDTERGRHSVMIRVISRPVAGATSTSGQSRIHALCDLVHAAVKDLTHGRGRMNFEYKNVESGEDGATDSGVLRYTITI